MYIIGVDNLSYWKGFTMNKKKLWVGIVNLSGPRWIKKSWPPCEGVVNRDSQLQIAKFYFFNSTNEWIIILQFNYYYYLFKVNFLKLEKSVQSYIHGLGINELHPILNLSHICCSNPPSSTYTHWDTEAVVLSLSSSPHFCRWVFWNYRSFFDILKSFLLHLK